MNALPLIDFLKNQDDYAECKELFNIQAEKYGYQQAVEGSGLSSLLYAEKLHGKIIQIISFIENNLDNYERLLYVFQTMKDQELSMIMGRAKAGASYSTSPFSNACDMIQAKVEVGIIKIYDELITKLEQLK